MQRRTGRFANKNGVSLGSSSSCNTCILVHQGTKELHMVRYRRLTLMEREEISRLLAVGHSLRATAHVLGLAPSRLIRELA
jgi:hypothetical protein